MKSCSEMYNDSVERANQSFDVFEKLHEDNYQEYYIINNVSHGEYIVTVENGIPIDCTCPHYQYRLKEYNIPCKHMIKIANYLK